jgi:hypothetical protein
MNGNGTGGGGAGTGLVNNVMQWFQHPFTQQGSAFNWILFVGLLLVAAWMWNVILLHLTEDL